MQRAILQTGRGCSLRHPYTRMLLDAIPRMHDTGRARTPVQGEVPNPMEPPSGCSFHPRCRTFLALPAI